ncbi:hypothetical protein [Thalassiella azotivora]
MRHPSDGDLRRLVDDPAGVSDPDRRHVAGCPRCLTALAGVREDADAVRSAFAVEPAGAQETAVAWQRLVAAAPAREASAASPHRRPSRLREALRRPAAAALAAAVVVGGGATAAANDWFQVFRTEQVAPVSFSAADLSAVPDLEEYGDLELVEGGEVREVSGAEEAAEVTGLDLPEVTTLPRGVSGEPVYQAGEQVTAVFTVDTDRAAAAAARAGEPAPVAPVGLDGTQVRLTAGPGVAAVWSSQAADVPSLVVGRAVAPTASSSGADFETVREYLLSVPGMPDDVAAQLRAFSADGSTLPLPVPQELATSSDAEVDGAPATVLTSRDRTFAAVVWVDDGEVTVVAGAVDADEVLAVARGLR